MDIQSSELINYKVPFQRKGKSALSTQKKIVNIEFCKNLPRDGLEYQVKERQILLYKTKSNEYLFLQYPGKESANLKNMKPWDFRPKLLKPEGYFLQDLSFSDIWNALYESFNKVESKDKLLRLLATEFYRIAFMLNYKLTNPNQEFLIRDYDTSAGAYSKFRKYGINNDLYLYQPNPEILILLSESIPQIMGVSWEGFLLYNDLLAFNEDCKYFYRSHIIKGSDGYEDLGNGTGRTNTLLTHINIIGFLLDEIKFSDILMRAVRSRGVAPTTTKELKKIMGDFLI